MVDFLVGTDGTATSERLCEYLAGRVREGDTVYAVNSLVGGGETDETDVQAGEEALDVFEARLGGRVAVDVHQFVRGNDPATDLLAAAESADSDELDVGIRRRSPAGKVIFGSTAQEVLLNSTRPVLAVPLERPVEE